MQRPYLRELSGEELDQLAIDTIRRLSIDAIEAAKSSHPGTPMALAPLVYTIWNKVLHFISMPSWDIFEHRNPIATRSGRPRSKLGWP